MQVTLNHVSELLNISYRVIRRRVSAASLQPVNRDGRKAFYESSDVIPVAMGVMDDEDGRLDLSQERAKLAKVQTQRYELELQTLQRQLIRVEDIIAQYGAVVAEYRQKMLALPSKLVTVIEAEETQHTKVEAAKKLVYEALVSLANAGN